GGREVAGVGDSSESAVDASAIERTDTHQFTSGLAWHPRHGHRCDDGVPLLLSRARRRAAHVRNGFRTAHDDFLLPYWRTSVGAAAWFLRARQRICGSLPCPDR